MKTPVRSALLLSMLLAAPSGCRTLDAYLNAGDPGQAVEAAAPTPDGGSPVEPPPEAGPGDAAAECADPDAEADAGADAAWDAAAEATSEGAADVVDAGAPEVCSVQATT